MSRATETGLPKTRVFNRIEFLPIRGPDYLVMEYVDDGAFLVNEYIIDNTTWGSRIAQIHFP